MTMNTEKKTAWLMSFLQKLITVAAAEISAGAVMAIVYPNSMRSAKRFRKTGYHQ